jgi:hypothetical protein
MDVILQTGCESPFLALRDVRLFPDGSGASARLEVRSRGFAAEVPFLFEVWSLRSFLAALRELDRTLKGKARLAPQFEPTPYLEVEATRLGRLRVRGEVSESSDMPQELRFEFEADPTCLGPLQRDLERCLDPPGASGSSKT